MTSIRFCLFPFFVLFFIITVTVFPLHDSTRNSLVGDLESALVIEVIDAQKSGFLAPDCSVFTDFSSMDPAEANKAWVTIRSADPRIISRKSFYLSVLMLKRHGYAIDDLTETCLKGLVDAFRGGDAFPFGDDIVLPNQPI